MRTSLSVKLTLTSTLLVAIVVAFLGLTNAQSIRDKHNAWADARSADFRANVAELADSNASLLSIAVLEHLIGSELAPLKTVVDELARRDKRVVRVRIANGRGNVLADSAAAIDPLQLQQMEAPAGKGTFDPFEAESQRDGKRVLNIRRPIIAAGRETPVGVVDFDFDLSALDAALAQIETERRDAMGESIGFTIKVGLLALVIGALLSLLQGLRYAGPIRRMAQTTKRLAEGDLGARVAVGQRDEIGALGEQFNNMADRIQTLVAESVSKAELDHELTLARQIQTALVPGPGPHMAPGIEVAGYYEPASNIGGDFWDLSSLPRGRAAILIGDVTGHGVPAAILTATAKGCLDTLRHVHGGDLQVAETMRVLDRVIHDAGHGAFFMTATAIVLDAAEQAMYYSAAAHPPGMLLRWTESGLRISRLVARGNRLGDGDAAGFEANRIRVAKDDLLIWYTDGLTDATNDEGRAYSQRQLLHVLGRIDPRTIGPAEVVRMVSLDLQRFRNGAPLPDDVTLVVGRVA
jgi:sigma-B regulation protein RsbU (phosphoserine phosphatase)